MLKEALASITSQTYTPIEIIVVNDAGVFISNGKGATIELLGPSVMINKVALVVT